MSLTHEMRMVLHGLVQEEIARQDQREWPEAGQRIRVLHLIGAELMELKLPLLSGEPT